MATRSFVSSMSRQESGQSRKQHILIFISSTVCVSARTSGPISAEILNIRNVDSAGYEVLERASIEQDSEQRDQTKTVGHKQKVAPLTQRAATSSSLEFINGARLFP